MKVVGKIIAVLYSIIFTIVLFCVSLSIGAGNLLKGSFYADVLESVNLKEISASDLGLTDNPDESLQDVLVDQLKESGLSEDVSNAILDNKEIKEVVGDVIGQVINYSINKDVKPKITKEQVNVIMENKDVKQLIGEDFSDDDINVLVDALNDYLKEFADNGGLNGN